MEENYKLEKEFKVSAELFREAYLAFQKKFVYPKSRVYMILFIAIAVGIFIFGALTSGNTSDKQKYIVYIAFVLSCAFAAKEWYTPKKMHRNITESVKTLGEPVYKIGISEKYVDISTVSDDLSNICEEERDMTEDTDPLPEKTRISLDSSYSLLEYEAFFLLMQGTEIFYIIPKEGFTEVELEIVRGTNL